MQNREWNLIDFHGKFLEDYMKWSVAHPEEAAREEDSDAHYYDMYADWLNTPKDWLGGVSPRGYFAEIQDAPMLVSAFMEYILQEMEVPDPLAERLVAEAEAVYPIFLHILMEDAPQEDISPEELQQIRAEILPLIGEMHKPHPYLRYIALLEGQTEETALAEELAEALMETGTKYFSQMLAAYARADGYARMAFLDLFSRMPGEDKAFFLLRDALEEPDADVAFLADCLGRLGDPRAVEAMKKVLYRPGLAYYQFKELKNAIEELSGEELEEMDFSGDALYEYLKEDHDAE